MASDGLAIRQVPHLSREVQVMSRQCALCGYTGSDGMHHGVHTVCFRCLSKVIDFAVTAEMRFERRKEE